MQALAKCFVFSMIHGSGRSKSRLAKAAGAEVAVQRRNEKLHAAVARSTFSSLFEVRMWRIARQCGPKHISKSKCTKHTMLGPLLEVGMCKNSTPL